MYSNKYQLSTKSLRKEKTCAHPIENICLWTYFVLKKKVQNINKKKKLHKKKKLRYTSSCRHSIMYIQYIHIIIC